MNPTVRRVEAIVLPERPPAPESAPAEVASGTITAATDEAEAALLRHAAHDPSLRAVTVQGDDRRLTGVYEPAPGAPPAVGATLIVLA